MFNRSPYGLIPLCFAAGLSSIVHAAPTLNEAAANDLVPRASCNSSKFYVQASGGGVVDGTWGKIVGGGQIQFTHDKSHATLYQLTSPLNYLSRFHPEKAPPKFVEGLAYYFDGNSPIPSPIFLVPRENAKYGKLVCSIDPSDCSLSCQTRRKSKMYTDFYIYHDPNQYTLWIGNATHDDSILSPVTVITVPAD